MEKFKPQF